MGFSLIKYPSSFLEEKGYNAVSIPKPTYKPLQLFQETGKGNILEKLGELTELFMTRRKVPLPIIHENVPLPQFSGQISGDFDSKTGFSILGGIISFFGGSASGVEGEYKRAKSIIFQYEEVLEDSVSTLQLDKFLKIASVNPLNSDWVKKLLESDKVYVTTSTIKSRKFTILAKDSNGKHLAVKLSEIEKLVGSNITVSNRDRKKTTITFEGKTPLVFGCKGRRMFFDKYGKLTDLKPIGPHLQFRKVLNRRKI